MPSPPEIQALLAGGGRYDPEIIPKLEAHVKDQLEQGSYDIDANLAILKLYLLHPDESKVEIIEGVLLKALMAFPSPDFALCMYEIPEKYHPQLKEVTLLAQQLEMTRFKAFWKTAESADALKTAKGWQASVRNFIAGVIADTYRSIRTETLLELLNMQAGELDALIRTQGWTRSKEDKEVVVVNTKTFESGSVTVETKVPTHMSVDQYKGYVMVASST